MRTAQEIRKLAKEHGDHFKATMDIVIHVGDGPHDHPHMRYWYVLQTLKQSLAIMEAELLQELLEAEVFVPEKFDFSNFKPKKKASK